jgi:hypothetical protein
MISLGNREEKWSHFLCINLVLTATVGCGYSSYPIGDGFDVLQSIAREI